MYIVSHGDDSKRQCRVGSRRGGGVAGCSPGPEVRCTGACLRRHGGRACPVLRSCRHGRRLNGRERSGRGSCRAAKRCDGGARCVCGQQEGRGRHPTVCTHGEGGQRRQFGDQASAGQLPRRRAVLHGHALGGDRLRVCVPPRCAGPRTQNPGHQRGHLKRTLRVCERVAGRPREPRGTGIPDRIGRCGQQHLQSTGHVDHDQVLCAAVLSRGAEEAAGGQPCQEGHDGEAGCRAAGVVRQRIQP